MEEKIAPDISHLIHTMLLYQIAARMLNKMEIESTVNGTCEAIIEQLSVHYNKDMVEKISRSCSQTIKDTIYSIQGTQNDTNIGHK